jgi:CrcB protein
LRKDGLATTIATRMARFLWVCLAGAMGTGVRYLVGVWAGRTLGGALPYGTLIVNVVGCFLIAAVMHVAVTHTLIPPTLRFALTTGFIGGLTTYSSFNFETTRLFGERAWLLGAMYFVATVVGCFLAGLLGLALARRFVGP